MTPCQGMASSRHLQLRHAATTINDYANTQTERKASNREHLMAFSFYFRTSKYCNPTPPFAYYKRGGRDPQRGGETREKAMPSNGNVLSTHPKKLKRTHSQRREPSLSRPACNPLLQALRCRATRAVASTGRRDVRPESVYILCPPCTAIGGSDMQHRSLVPF
jgi:hypothetical protein